MLTGKGVGIVLLLALLGLTSCSEDYFPEPEKTGGWRKNFDPAFARSLGLDPEGVRQFGAYCFRVTGTYSALVIKDGWVVGEWHAHEGEEKKKAYVASIGKSFTLASFGVAVKDSREGKLPLSIDRSSKLYDQRWLAPGFPLSDPLKKNISFEHVFRHMAGFGPEELKGWDLRDEWVNYVSWLTGHDPQWPETQQLFYPPGKPLEYEDYEQWGDHAGVYSSVGFAHIGLVLSQLYGVPAHTFLWDRLLEPIGFSGIDYQSPPSPPEIMWFTGGGLKMTSPDLARFAYFLLKDGVWKGERILPEGWVRSFTQKPYYQNLRSNVDHYFGARYPADMYRLYGSGGNFVFVVPSLDIIVIRTGYLNNFFLEKLQHDFLRRAFNMIPAYRTN